MRLLDKAKSKKNPFIRQGIVSQEEVELVISFAKGEISLSQFEYALELKSGGGSKAFTLLRKAIRNGHAKIILPQHITKQEEAE